MKRGEVWWADLAPRSGSEHDGRRPVVIVSHNAFNLTEGWKSIVVVPLSTSALQARRGPTAPAVPKGAAGLRRSSVALCHQVTTLDRSKLTHHVGTLPAEVIAGVDAGLRAALALT
jgi:mRNA interferase MazF